MQRLVVYHFRKPTDDDENRIVTGALPTMSRYWERLQVSIVFPGNEFSSFLSSQLRSDDFRNVRQAMEMHNSLDIFPAIKLILGRNVFFRSVSLEFSKKMTCVLQKQTQYRELLVTVGKGFEYSARRSSWLLWGKTLCFVNNCSKRGIERATRLSKKSSKSCQSSRVLCI